MIYLKTLTKTYAKKVVKANKSAVISAEVNKTSEKVYLKFAGNPMDFSGYIY